jgi:hypothetical protein
MVDRSCANPATDAADRRGFLIRRLKCPQLFRRFGETAPANLEA